MKPEKLPLNSIKATDEKRPKDIASDYGKVKLKRSQYISNLIATNQACLRNNNINTLLLF